MVVPIKFLVEFGALQPEIGAQVDHPAPLLQQRHRKFGRNSMRQRQEHQLRLLGEQVGFWFGEAQCPGFGVTCKFGENLGDGLTGILSRGDGDNLDGSMMQEQAD